jgi:hypothetical protein
MLDVESTPAEDRAQAGDQSIPMDRSLGDAVERFFRTLPAQSH